MPGVFAFKKSKTRGGSAAPHGQEGTERRAFSANDRPYALNAKHFKRKKSRACYHYSLLALGEGEFVQAVFFIYSTVALTCPQRKGIRGFPLTRSVSPCFTIVQMDGHCVLKALAGGLREHTAARTQPSPAAATPRRENRMPCFARQGDGNADGSGKKTPGYVRTARH